MENTLSVSLVQAGCGGGRPRHTIRPAMAIDTSKTTAVAGNGTASSSCWSCGEMRAAQFCKACGKVQPPAPVDYFRFFAMPRKMNVDVERLEREFYELS